MPSPPARLVPARAGIARWLLLASVAAVGCGPTPQRVRVVDRVEPGGGYTTRDVELETLRDLMTAAGDAAQMWGGATFDLEAARPVDDAGSADDIVQGERNVRVSWIARGDVAVPTDYHSLNILSAYAHLEEAYLYFGALGSAAANDPVAVYYQPQVDPGPAAFPSTDNAAYFANVDGLVLLPMSVLQEIPFSMNPGVLAHEYGHRVWYHEAWGGDMFAILLTGLRDDDDLNTWNLIRALDEGVADFFGAAITGDPNFIEASLGPSFGSSRDLREEWAMVPEWIGGAEPTLAGAYNPYPLGTVAGALLWSFGEIAGTEAVAVAVLAEMRALSGRLHASFEYRAGDFEARVIGRLDPALRAPLCARALLSYAAAWSRFAGVCP